VPVNLKRKQALLESNLPAIRLTQDNSQKQPFTGCFFILIIGLPYRSKKLKAGIYS
jgi:hypothetical protein